MTTNSDIGVSVVYAHDLRNPLHFGQMKVDFNTFRILHLLLLLHLLLPLHLILFLVVIKKISQIIFKEVILLVQRGD